MFGVSFTAGLMLKETTMEANPTAPGTEVMKSVSGERVTVSVTEKKTSIYEIAFLDTEELAHMNFLVALVDKRADPDGALMEYSFKIATPSSPSSRS